MKKIILVGCLAFITACQTTTPTTETSYFSSATLPPSPIPNTPTPELTFTPAPSLTPLPRYFTTNFESSLAGWVVLQAGNQSVPNVVTEEGTLRMEMDSAYTWLYALYGPEDYNEVHIETEYVSNALNPSSAGLLCRYSEENGWLEFNVVSDGNYNVLFAKWLSPGIAEYTPVTDGPSAEIGRSGEIQTIGLTCLETTMQLYINGSLIRNIDISRFEFTEGKVGLAASSYENTPIIITFRSMAVSEP